jgi:hypothetical protein
MPNALGIGRKREKEKIIEDAQAAHEGFSYSIVLSAFLTPYSFSVTFFYPLVFALFYSAANKRFRRRLQINNKHT